MSMRVRLSARVDVGFIAHQPHIRESVNESLGIALVNKRHEG